MTTDPERGSERRPLSEVVKGPQPKPPLGPPHDGYATFGLGVFSAVALFFIGYARTVDDWIGWTGMILSLAAVVACFYYFGRAYGFRNRGWNEDMPTGAYFAMFFGFMFAMQFVAPAIYVHYAGESTLGLVVSYLSLSALVIAPMRLALGKAPQPEIPVEDSSSTDAS